MNKINNFTDKHLDDIADALGESGYIILTDAMDSDLLQNLQQRISYIPSHQWRQAGVGRNQTHQINAGIRSDRICWMNTDDSSEIEFFKQMESLRIGLNRRLYLGLFDYESHFAIYPKGSFYQRHVDTLKGMSNRVLSTVLYLNENWCADNGGELLIYKGNEIVQSVIPKLGTMVVFLSEAVEHEVVKANRTRHSIAGWFRVNPSHSGNVDPSH